MTWGTGIKLGAPAEGTRAFIKENRSSAWSTAYRCQWNSPKRRKSVEKVEGSPHERPLSSPQDRNETGRKLLGLLHLSE